MPSFDVEEAVVAWLNTILPSGYSASGDKPDDDPTPDTYVTVDRTGGPREAMVLDRASILIEVFNKGSRTDAKNVAQSIADQVPNLVFVDDNLTHASVNSVVHLDDTLAQYYRYQVYCDINGRR